MKKLIPHHSNKSNKANIEASWEFFENSIEFTITVYDYDKSNINSKYLVSDWNNIGLWDYDVVEVFISRSNKLPYLELQSSPINQNFALIINNPRLETIAPYKIETKIDISSQNPWVTVINIPFSDIPGSGNILYGNCFSCLGSAKNRNYYALNINKEDNANFHKPELFIRFGQIGIQEK
jgi:hypothetical protein